MRLFIIFAIFFQVGICVKQNYDGYKVYRINITNENDFNLLKSIQKSEKNVEFLTEPNLSNIPVDILISPENNEKFFEIIFKHKISIEILIEDVQSIITQQNNLQTRNLTEINWTEYHTLETIYGWLDNLPENYPGKVSVINIGPSFQDRVLKGVKISYGSGKRAVFIEGGIHAREWISPATVTYIINEILTSTDPLFRRIVESFDWYIFPVVNPDGFVYSHVQTRYWRKTRTTYERCTGADANRNWDFHWGEAGTSDFVCDDTYGGPNAFSEKEVVALANFIETIGSNMDVFLSFHSYSQLLLMPYGNTTEHLDNYDDMLKIGKKTIEALSVRYNTTYRVGNAAEILVTATGISMDWVKDKFKVPMVFTYELRDTGKFGFLLPPTEIIPNCEEIIDSLIAMFSEAEKLGYFNLNK